jgi:hypothetical protein
VPAQCGGAEKDKINKGRRDRILAPGLAPTAVAESTYSQQVLKIDYDERSFLPGLLRRYRRHHCPIVLLPSLLAQGTSEQVSLVEIAFPRGLNRLRKKGK